MLKSTPGQTSLKLSFGCDCWYINYMYYKYHMIPIFVLFHHSLCIYKTEILCKRILLVLIIDHIIKFMLIIWYTVESYQQYDIYQWHNEISYDLNKNHMIKYSYHVIQNWLIYCNTLLNEAHYSYIQSVTEHINTFFILLA